jgi:hypothetical protein
MIVPSSVSDRVWDRALQLVIAVMGTIAALVAVALWLGETPHFPAIEINPKQVEIGLYVLQTAIIGVLLVFMPHLPKMKRNDETKNAISASHQFLLFFNLVWLAWFFFYFFGMIVRGARVELPISTPGGMALHLSGDVLNLTSSAFIFFCYVVMAEPTVGKDNPDHGWFHDRGWFQTVSAVFFVIVVLIMMEAVTTTTSQGSGTFFDALYGLLSGVTIALFAGRLQSMLIGLPFWPVTAIYAYAVLQFAYPVISTATPPASDEVVLQATLPTILVVTLALLFKIVLFREVRRIVVNRTLTYYMLEVREMYAKISQEREAVIREKLVPEAEP